MAPIKNVRSQFVGHLDGALWLADRRSEHVACARGTDVLAAGEISFDRADRRVRLIDVTNLSTRYCPAPESWEAVSRALLKAQIEPPDSFTTCFVFRRCPQCQSTNLVKENVFECLMCGAALPEQWNF